MVRIKNGLAMSIIENNPMSIIKQTLCVLPFIYLTNWYGTFHNNVGSMYTIHYLYYERRAVWENICVKKFKHWLTF